MKRSRMLALGLSALILVSVSRARAEVKPATPPTAKTGGIVDFARLSDLRGGF